MNKTLLIGLGITALATSALIIGVLRELKAIRELTIDAEEIPEGVEPEVQILAEEVAE